MKKTVTVISLFLFLLTTNMVYAQDEAVKTGAKGGLNFATMSDGFDTRTGFVVGGFAKFSIPDSPLSIQPEALYSQQGGEQDGSEIRIDYLQVPVLFKFAMSQGGTAEPNLFAGPYAGLRLTAEQDGGTGFLGGSTNIENRTESVDYGLALGGGIDIEVGNSIFTMDARYNLGLADVFNDVDGKHRVFAITFGISLPSGGTQ